MTQWRRTLCSPQRKVITNNQQNEVIWSNLTIEAAPGSVSPKQGINQ